MTKSHYKEVYLYGTCLIDTLYPNAGMAAFNLLQQQGINVLFPQDQTCCGQPAWNAGLTKDAQSVALKQIDAFPKLIPIIVPSASCAGMMKHQYPSLFRGTPHAKRAEAFSSRVFEFTEFLVKELNIVLEDKGSLIEISLHQSCSAQREMKVAHYASLLISQLKNVHLKSIPKSQECCGFGGTFSVNSPKISAAMTKDKCAAIQSTAADLFVCGDSGCMMNIVTASERHSPLLSLPSEHLISFLWNRTQ